MFNAFFRPAHQPALRPFPQLSPQQRYAAPPTHATPGPQAFAPGMPWQAPQWLPAQPAGPAASHFFQAMPTPLPPQHWLATARMPWLGVSRIIPPPSAGPFFEAAQAGDRNALQQVFRRNLKYESHLQALPHVATLDELGTRTGHAVQGLDYSDRRTPPVMLIGGEPGSPAGIEAVGRAAHAMAGRGAVGNLLIEFPSGQLPLLRHLESLARGMIHEQGGYRLGMVDQLTRAFMPVAQQQAALAGQPRLHGKALAAVARTWATQILAAQRARDAGFNVVAMGTRNEHGSVEQHEAQMRAVLQQHQQHPSIVLTNGLQTNALLPALGHSNWRALTSSQPQHWVENSEMVRRNFHQGVHEDPRFQMVMLAPQAAQGEAFLRG